MPDKVDHFVWAAYAIHNWLRQTCALTYLPPRSVDLEDAATGEVILGHWWEQVGQLFANDDLRSFHKYRCDAQRVRESYAEYFVGEGAAPWQWRKIGGEPPLLKAFLSFFSMHFHALLG